MSIMMMKIRASKCEIKTVGTLEERLFLNKYHYQKYIPSKICLGLYYENELIELMSFGTPRYTRKYDWELLRLCTKKEYQVYGGASRLFKHFYRDYPGSVVSYCNESKFTGSVYTALGFTKIGTCKSYHYERDGTSYHRTAFQKWKLLRMFPQYKGTDYTERAIMAEQGYTRIDEVQATWSYGKKWMVYRTTNLLNGKTYIGQHRYNELDDNYLGSGKLILAAISKYGRNNFKREILLADISCQEDADKYEKCAIFSERLNGKAQYNLADGGQNHTAPIKYDVPWNRGKKLRPLSEEHKKKLSEVLKGRKVSEETKRKLSLANKGRKRTEETRRKISEASKGRPKSDETRAKLSASNKGKKRSAEACEKMKGRKVTDETRAKLSASNKGKKRSAEACEKMSERMKGSVMSEETKKKISDFMKSHPNKGQFQKGHVMSEETRAKISAKMKETLNNPENKAKISAKLKTAYWWNNGTENTRSPECPGEGWVRGKLQKKHWKLVNGVRVFY